MYLEFFGLSERPFTTSPDPGFLYWSEAHSLAYTVLRYGIMSKAQLTVITGEIGAGKTTLVRQLLREVAEADVRDLEVGLLSNIQAGRGELLHWVLSALGETIGSDESYVALFRRLQDHLVASYAAGRRVILVFDEAQNMDAATLEELRMLSNINTDKDDILQIVLVGQPQLRDLLARPELKQFSQRIAADFHLSALDEADVHRYIDHRLEVAGATWRIFVGRTPALITQATGGVPRLVNILCDLCLVYAYAADSRVVDELLVREFLASARSRGIYDQLLPVPNAPELVRKAP